MDKNRNDSSMEEWLKKHFEVSSTCEKVPVQVVRAVFNQKFSDKSNNTFGKVVRKAFPEITRGRDGGGYIYRPLKSRVTTIAYEDQQGDKNQQSQSKCSEVDATIQISEERELLKTKIQHLESKSSSLEKNAETLKRENSQLMEKNRKLKEALAKRRRTEADFSRNDKASQSNKSTMVSVNLIISDDLEGEPISRSSIGEGSYGECRVQRFKRTDTLVVVKTMKFKQPDAVIREARAMQSVTSQRFPFVYGVQLAKPPYSIVMEFIGNPETKTSSTLYQVVASKEKVFQDMKREIERKTWVKICQDIAEGLRHLHAAKILHNDLKNNNVLVHKNRGFIIDLGKSCEASSPPAGKKYSHSYQHLAPEVLKGGCFSYENDIFSLGQILNFVRKFCNVFELRELEKDCINKNYVMRPTASTVAEKLGNMHQSL